MAAAAAAALRPRRASRLHGVLSLAALAAALAAVAPLLVQPGANRSGPTGVTFLAPVAQPRAAAASPISAPPAVPGPEPAEPEGPSLRAVAAAALCGGSLAAALQASGLIERDVARCGAVPKKKRPKHKTRQARINWYNKGNRAAKRALELAEGIKAGTENFIYGKPQDEDDYEDDEYDDDYDDDDDELDKKSLS
mmetsp:Transcript_78925/g.235231  ORF Transcript_78925/g.235231 Transcript_78925/m.235231 type:complete len:195 (-) Transcript_78925:57-641(-)|eukprot:CAMPEP_0175231604 /NCGR_PEP_ID=MMETSP0093-20121207/25541_1 /TAXON_ID=311494 /ORGANISM="Alexandrium monilatum, Strain CCMP3105" /LENGTH=194 /DNA_ID=CAMNT_0016525459 /DNA_START=67 /DNA_END=651 /DNA_ORIENTATION=+